MNVSLTQELEELINDKVRAGLYRTASEVIRDALRLLKQRDDEARRADQRSGLTVVGPERKRGRSSGSGGRQRGRR